MDNLLKSQSIYNDRTKIKPYEIDVYYPEFNLAFEYQGKLWHKTERTDHIKLKIFKEKNINIIYIIENNRRYEEDIKNQIITNLLNINNICHTIIKQNDVLNCVVGNIYEKLYNKEGLINVAKQYTSFKIFVKTEPSIYNKLKKLNLLDIATNHMTDRRLHKHTTETLLNNIQKYTTLKDLIENDWGIYQHIKRNNLSHLISHLHTTKKHHQFSLETINNTIKKYTKKFYFRTENPQMYQYLKTHKLTHLLSGLQNRVK